MLIQKCRVSAATRQLETFLALSLLNTHKNIKSNLSIKIKQWQTQFKLLLAGAVGVFVGDLSGNLAGESEQLVSTSQQSHVPHAELGRRLVHRQLHIAHSESG